MDEPRDGVFADTRFAHHQDPDVRAGRARSISSSSARMAGLWPMRQASGRSVDPG
jgi:hypothetical protein